MWRLTYLLISSRFLLSPVRLSVCLSSVTFVRPTQVVQIFGNISTALGTLAIRWHPLKISLSLFTSVWLGDSCWSGFVGRVRGWRTERPTTRCPVRAASWPSSATTAALTSRQKSTRRRSWRRRSTRYRLDCDSATGRRTCQQRARWCRSVVSELVAKSLQPAGARGLPSSPHQSWRLITFCDPWPIWPSVNWPMTHLTHDLWPMTYSIYDYRLHTCCANSRHVATHSWNWTILY